MAALLDIVRKGSADRSVCIRIINATTGAPETGVLYNTSGIDLWYRREGAAKTSITEATLAALTTAHTDGGFLHVSDGEYRLDLPDAAFATGANYVDIGGTVTSMVVIGGRVRLVDYDPEDAVGLGLTRLDAAVSSRMATYTQPTGFLAASFPTDPADQSLVIAATDAILTAVNTKASQASVDDVPTNAELVTALGTADDAVLAAIAALNNLSSAQAQTAAAAALTAYDPPTHAELVSEVNAVQSDIAGLNDLTAAEVNAEVDTALTDYDGPTNTELATALAAADDAVLTAIAALNNVSAASVATAVLAAGDVDGYTLEGVLKLCLAALAGKVSGAATTTVTFRAADDSKDRIVATVDADGNRSTVTLDATG